MCLRLLGGAFLAATLLPPCVRGESGSVDFEQGGDAPSMDFETGEMNDVDDGLEVNFLTEAQASKVHAAMDLDKDGLASMDEIVKYGADVKHIISKRDIRQLVAGGMDANGDGFLALDEFLKDVGLPTPEEDKDNPEAKVEIEKFKASDVNGDGKLDPDEMPYLFFPETHDGVLSITARVALLGKDRDGDGELSPSEFWRASDDDSEPEPQSKEEMDDFNALDEDKNGKLSQKEMEHWESGLFHKRVLMDKLFEVADKDNDKRVSLAELLNARAEIASNDIHYLMDWAEHEAEREEL